MSSTATERATNSSSEKKRKRQSEEEGKSSAVEMAAASGEEPQLSPSASAAASDEASSAGGGEPVAAVNNGMNNTRFCGWLDDGQPKSDGRIEHESFSLAIGNEVFELSLGDAVITRKHAASSLVGHGGIIDDGEEEHISFGDMEDSFDYYGNADNKATASVNDINKYMIARVERIWEEEYDDDDDADQRSSTSRSSRFQFLARWFLRSGEVESLQGNFSGGSVTSTEDFLSKLTDRDLVLGDQTDTNPLTSICGTVQIVYRNPESDQVLPEMPSYLYACRYSASINDDSTGQVDVIPFTGEDDEWPESESESESDDDDDVNNTSQDRIKQSRSTDNSIGTTGASYDSSSSDSESQGGRGGGPHGRSTAAAAAFDEGTTEQRDIRIGPGHQAIVPPFIPNQRSVSRKPTRVWKQGGISDTGMDLYLSKASNILTTYLRSNMLTQTEQYSPLQWERVETLYKSLSGSAVPPTLSTVCTASSLSTPLSDGVRADMLRECDSDSILANLNEHDYDVEASLAAISANPRGFLTVWSMQEKDLFNSGFRRYSGSLRMIYKGIAPSKGFKDVIDYHYRFKIPDQFRSFQDKKREQAVRMMECIETKRNIAAGIQNSNLVSSGTEPAAKKRIVESEWPKSGISDLTGAVEDRRLQAKKLLLDIESQLGKEKFLEIVDIIKRLNQKSLPTNLRAVIVDICDGHPHMEKRLLEFLPKRVN